MVSATTEKFIVVRPIKVISFMCCCISLLLLIIAMASTFWLESEGYRQGLWSRCVSFPAPTPLPYDTPYQEGCSSIESAQPWLKTTRAFSIICLVCALLGGAVVAIGLITKDRSLKRGMYLLSCAIMLFGVVLMTIALLIFPIKFSNEMSNLHREEWEFGWAYGVAWGAAIFLFGGSLCLICDGDEQEIFYKEKTVTIGESSA